MMSEKWGHGLILPAAERCCAVAAAGGGGVGHGKAGGHRVGGLFFPGSGVSMSSVSGEEHDEQTCLTLRENEHRKLSKEQTDFPNYQKRPSTMRGGSSFGDMSVKSSSDRSIDQSCLQPF